jgi:hypothetical protein
MDTEAERESGGNIHTLENRISGIVDGPTSQVSLYLGSLLVALSLLLIAGGVASYAYGMQLSPGTVRYWVAFEAAYAAGAASIPFLLAGVTVLFSSSKRLRLGAGIGTVACISAIGLFTLAYPGGWQVNTQSPMSWVVGLYGLGLLLLVLCAGITIGGQGKPDRQRRSDRTELEQSAEPHAVTESSQSSEEYIVRILIDKSDGGACLSDLYSSLSSASSVTLTPKVA